MSNECEICGGHLSKNPHPDAGKPEHLLEIGAQYECLPCLYGRSRRRFREIASLRQQIVKLEKIIRDRDDRIEGLKRQLKAIQQQLAEEDQRIEELKEELSKYRNREWEGKDE